MSATHAPNDYTQYFTYLNPDDYLPHWRDFYEHAAQQQGEMTRLFANNLAVPYGPDQRHVANIYRPQTAGLHPAIIYFHGGRWREGHPDFYDHLGRPWVEDGAAFISCGYRLEPDATVADAVDDVSRAINWVVHNAAAYGIDPHQLTVAGHSAGAHLAVMACLTDWNEADFPTGGSVRNVWSMSGPMDLRSVGNEENGDLDPTTRLRASSAQVLVSFGEPEDNHRNAAPDMFAQQGRALVSALDRRDVSALEVAVADMNHIESAALLAQRDSEFYSLASEGVFGSDHHTPSRS